jgi:hypothetical protein
MALPDRISARHEDLPFLIDGLIDRNAAPHLDAVPATGDPGLRFPLAGFRASSAITSLTGTPPSVPPSSVIASLKPSRTSSPI